MASFLSQRGGAEFARRVLLLGSGYLNDSLGHGTNVQVGAINLCAGRIMAQCVRDPKGPLPLECVEELRFPGFVLPDGNMSR